MTLRPRTLVLVLISVAVVVLAAIRGGRQSAAFGRRKRVTASGASIFMTYWIVSALDRSC
jgi:hypothetical protein